MLISNADKVVITFLFRLRTRLLLYNIAEFEVASTIILRGLEFYLFNTKYAIPSHFNYFFFISVSGNSLKLDQYLTDGWKSRLVEFSSRRKHLKRLEGENICGNMVPYLHLMKRTVVSAFGRYGFHNIKDIRPCFSFVLWESYNRLCLKEKYVLYEVLLGRDCRHLLITLSSD